MRRGIFRRVIGTTTPSIQSAIQSADALADGAMHALEYEEPTLRRWLDTDDAVANLRRVHSIATHALLIRDARQQRPFEETMQRLDRLTYRTLCAVAVATAQEGRTSDRHA